MISRGSSNGGLPERTYIPLGAGLLCWLCLTVTGGHLSAQARVTLTVDDPRPLAAAARLLEQNLGHVITYEDARHAHPADVSDVTRAVRKDAAAGRPVLVPRGGAFSFTYEPRRTGDTPEGILEVVSRVVAEYNTSGYPGHYMVRPSEGVLHIIPTAVRGNDEAFTPQSSLLDTKPSLSAQEGRSAYAAAEAMTAAVANLTGRRIVIGSAPLHALGRVWFESGASGKPARQTLLAICNAAGLSCSWQLLYDPGLKLYVLNLYTVR